MGAEIEELIDLLSNKVKYYVKNPSNKSFHEMISSISVHILSTLKYRYDFSPVPIEWLKNRLQVSEIYQDIDVDTLLYKSERKGWTIVYDKKRYYRKNYGRKRFSLTHELIHILINIAKEREPFLKENLEENMEENLCNKLAAEILAPKKLFEDKQMDEIVFHLREHLPKEYIEKFFDNFCKGKFQPSTEIIYAMKNSLKISFPLLILQMNSSNLLTNYRWGAFIFISGNEYFAFPKGIIFDKKKLVEVISHCIKTKDKLLISINAKNRINNKLMIEAYKRNTHTIGIFTII